MKLKFVDMQKLILLSALFCLSINSIAQNYKQKFDKLYEDNDTVKIKTLLVDWEKSNPNDPELYTSAFNFYFSTSNYEVLALDGKVSGGEVLQLIDSTGKPAGYIRSVPEIKSEKLEKAFSYADKGIQKFPNRLDIRFGKCFVFGQIGDYENFTKEIIKTVEYSKTNGNNWQWTNNKKLDDGQDFMLNTIQEYLAQLYNTEDDALLENMTRIGDATIKHYPDKIEILSTTSVAHMLRKNYDKAIEYLKHAEKLNPKDFIVLNNIAQGYKLKGDKGNAIKYYELTEKYGDEQAKQQARQNIKELKKQ